MIWQTIIFCSVPSILILREQFTDISVQFGISQLFLFLGSDTSVLLVSFSLCGFIVCSSFRFLHLVLHGLLFRCKSLFFQSFTLLFFNFLTPSFFLEILYSLGFKFLFSFYFVLSFLDDILLLNFFLLSE